MVVCNNSAQQINVALKDLQKQLDSIKLEFQKTTAKSEESSEETATGIEGKINSLQKQINELQAQLNTANGNISNLNSNVISISNNLSDVNENASSAKTTANEAKTTADSAMPKSGGTFTGSINLPANQYFSDGKCGINMNNSDIIGANAIKMADAVDSNAEGIVWVRSNGTTETLRALDGKLTLGGKEFAYKDETANRAENNSAGRYLGGAFMSQCDNFDDLLNNELGSETSEVGGICGGSIYTKTTSYGLPPTWYNFLYIPHRTGAYKVKGDDNHKYGTLLIFYMVINRGTMKIIHRIAGYNYDGGSLNTVSADEPIPEGPTADEPIPDGPGV